MFRKKGGGEVAEHLLDVQSKSVPAKWRCRPRKGSRRWLGRSAFSGLQLQSKISFIAL